MYDNLFLKKMAWFGVVWPWPAPACDDDEPELAARCSIGMWYVGGGGY